MILKPKWLEEQQQTILNESTQAALNRVKVRPIRDTSYYKKLKELWDKTGKYSEWFQGLGILPKHKQIADMIVFPTDDASAVTAEDEFGQYLVSTDTRWLQAKYNLYGQVLKLETDFDENEWGRILCQKPLAGEPYDNPNVTTKIVREELNLTTDFNDSRCDDFKLFLETVFDGFTFNKFEHIFIKKDGSPGMLGLTRFEDKTTAYKTFYTDIDKFAVFKIIELRRLLSSFEEILNLLMSAEFDKLLEQHIMDFISRVVERLQEDRLNKVRLVREADALLTAKTKLTPVDFKRPVNRSYLGNISLSSEIRELIQACRRRLAYAGDVQSVIIPNILLDQTRTWMKTKWPKVFQFGSDDFIKEIIQSAVTTGDTMATLDVAQFDHSIYYGHLVTYHDFLWSKNSILGLLLSIQAISPIASGTLGYSRRLGKEVKNYIIGDPLDYKTFFFGQGKSGDADVADRCKLICSWLMVTMIIELLHLPYNKETIKSILEHNEKIKFLNLGDNNLLIFPQEMREAIDAWLKTNKLYRSELEKANVFGGKYIYLQDGKIVIRRSPLSFVIKLMCPEYSYATEKHRGWTEGFKQRILDASEESMKYNSNRLNDLINAIDKAMLSNFKTLPMDKLAQKWSYKFNAYVDKQNDLLHRLRNNSADSRVRELMLDPEKIKWKFTPEEFTQDIQDIIRACLFNKVDDQTVNTLNNIILEK